MDSPLVFGSSGSIDGARKSGFLPGRTAKLTVENGVHVRGSLWGRVAADGLRRTLAFGLIVSVCESSGAETQTLSTSASQMVFSRPEEPIAAPTNLPPSATSQTSAKKQSAPASLLFSGDLHVESMQYFHDVPENPSLSHSQFVSAQFVVEGSPTFLPSLSYKVDAGAESFLSAEESDYIVHEAEVTTHFGNSDVSATVGRKKEAWSEMDHRWQLGLWQPQFAIDTLRPEEEGLTGFFLDWNRPNFQILGFVTPIFLPTTGPDVREDNGSLVSDSRWYRTPSSNFDFTSTQQNKITYHLDVPDASDLIMNPGSALMMRLGQRDRGWWADSAWGHMPVNNLILRRQIVKPIDGSVIDATIEPEVGYHQIASADVGYSFPQVKASISFLQDNPDTVLPDAQSAIQQLQPLQAYSAQVDWTAANVFSRSILFQAGYLKVYGGGIVDVRSNGQPDDITLFDSRLIFTDAVSLGAQGELVRVFNKPLLAKVKYVYDRDQRGTLVNTEFQLLPSKPWVVVLGLDLLGVDDESYKPDSFLNQYRGNSRMYGGMSYVF